MESEEQPSDQQGGAIDREGVEMWSDSAIKRLDHVWETIETVQQHCGDQASIDALDDAKDQLEAAQEDINEIEMEINK